MEINLEYYKIFYYTAKFKSISGAAGALSITQPAVSQAVRHLEELLGCALFVRMSRGVKLTKEGEVLYRHVAGGYEMILSGERKLVDMLNLEAGEIRVGASDMTLQYYLLDHLEQFHKLYPNLRIAVTNAPTPLTVQHLQDGLIDFGVVSTPLRGEYEFQTIPVRKIQDVFVAGKEFDYLRGMKLTYKELEKLPVMALEGDTSTGRYIEEFLEKRGVKVKSEFELATSGMLVQFALRSLGVACVVRDFAEPYYGNEALFELEFDQEIPKRQFCILFNERAPLSAAAERLLSYLKENS